ncbi:hypothetical protein C8R44DRAFT_978239 [Mycena epipterygia]|nr:hypothetical protein C8R44DRAFT_978239 [Mycena epipterygia]
MPRPRNLELPAHGSSMPRKHIRSPRVLPSPAMKRAAWPQQQYLMKFIHRKITYGTNQSKLVIHALRRRLLRRGLNSPRTPRTAFVSNGSDAWETKQQEQECIGSSAILLPQLPLLSLPCLFPETTDSGYCSDASPSSSSSPHSDVPPRPIRRYILPDRPLAGSPSDLLPTAEIRIRLSAQPASPSLPPLRFEPFEL